MVLQEDVRAALQEAPVCFLATCGNDVPNVVPVGYKWLVGNELLLADRICHNITPICTLVSVRRGWSTS